MNENFLCGGLTVSFAEDGYNVSTFHIGSGDHGVGGGYISVFSDVSHELA